MSQPSPLLDLLRRRIVVAPMAGGATTTDLVIAAAGDAGWDDDSFDGKIAALLTRPRSPALPSAAPRPGSSRLCRTRAARWSSR